jgi:hypothetical protein
MDVSQLLLEISNELDIKTDDVFVNNEITSLKKALHDAISNIELLRTDREEYINAHRANRLARKIFTPYVMYLTMFMKDALLHNKDIGSELNKHFVTAVLQKHLESLDNNEQDLR